MVKNFAKLSGISLFTGLLFAACSTTNNKPLLIDFSTDSSVIVFSNIDQTGLFRLREMKTADSVFNSLISVLETPSERDSMLKESPVEGKVMVTDSNLVFIPAFPFVRGRDYLVITHLNAKFGNAKDLLKGEVANRVQPQQKLLTR